MTSEVLASNRDRDRNELEAAPYLTSVTKKPLLNLPRTTRG